MLKWIRGKRLDLRTTIILILIVLAAWALVIKINVENFIPAEFRQEQTTSGESNTP